MMKNTGRVIQDREKLKREEGRTIGAMKEIASWLDLEKLERVEAYDISNINGFETVGSMVVYEKGKPQRSDYRKFKLHILAQRLDCLTGNHLAADCRLDRNLKQMSRNLFL